MAEEHIDNYDATLVFKRDWNNDAAVAKGAFPELPLDKAMSKYLLEEVQDLVDSNQILAISVEVRKITPPQVELFEPDIATSTMVQEILDKTQDILTSTKIADQALRDKTWEDLMDLIRHFPEYLEGIPVRVGSSTVVLKRKDYETVRAFVVDDKKIQAIKALRGYTGIGLKESKDAVEDYDNFRK